MAIFFTLNRASITKDPFYDLVSVRKKKVINQAPQDWTVQQPFNGLSWCCATVGFSPALGCNNHPATKLSEDTGGKTLTVVVQAKRRTSLSASLLQTGPNSVKGENVDSFLLLFLSVLTSHKEFFWQNGVSRNWIFVGTCCGLSYMDICVFLLTEFFVQWLYFLAFSSVCTMSTWVLVDVSLLHRT